MTVLTPSETARGRAWLSNFRHEDQAAAQELLNSIKFTQLSTMRQALQTFFWDLIGQRRIVGPTMLIPVLSMEDLPKLDPPSKHHIAFQTFSPGLPISSLPGSEGFIGNLIRDLLRTPMKISQLLLPPSTTLAELRERECRNIALITDYSGSGRQLWNHAMTLMRHPTLRSWRSGGFIRVHAISYAAASEALTITCKNRTPIDYLWISNSVPTFKDRPWTSEMRSAIYALCRRYTNSSHRREEFGYRSSACLFATEAGAPNNLPYILRRKEGKWQSFFEGRMVPTDLARELGDYTPEFDSRGLAVSTGQIRLAASPASRHMRTINNELLKVLAVLRRRRRNPSEMAALTGKSLPHIEQLIATLTRLGLIDENLELTARGVAELSAGKRKPREVSTSLKTSQDVYYPLTMR